MSDSVDAHPPIVTLLDPDPDAERPVDWQTVADLRASGCSAETVRLAERLARRNEQRQNRWWRRAWRALREDASDV